MARVNGITQFLPATHTTILTLLCKYSPDGTSRTKQYTSDIAYCSIYRPRKDERLSWPSWWPKWSPVSCRSSLGQGKFACQRQLTTVPRNQLNIIKFKSYCPDTHTKTDFAITRNTFCGTWYLPHSRVHKSILNCAHSNRITYPLFC